MLMRKRKKMENAEDKEDAEEERTKVEVEEKERWDRRGELRGGRGESGEGERRKC